MKPTRHVKHHDVKSEERADGNNIIFFQLIEMNEPLKGHHFII